MQTMHMPEGTRESLWDLQAVDQAQGKNWIYCGHLEQARAPESLRDEMAECL